MRINNNVMAMNTHRQYGVNNTNVSKSVEKLSSGYRVNRAGDDAAGLAISEKMRAQIRGLNMASKNSQDAVSLVQTAEGALQTTHDILQRMRELSTQSASDSNESNIDRAALNKEFQALIAEIDDTAAKTKFNDMGVIDGSFAGVGKDTTREVGTPTIVTAPTISGFSIDTSGITATADFTVTVSIAAAQAASPDYSPGAAGTMPTGAVDLGATVNHNGDHNVTGVSVEFTKMVYGSEESFNDKDITALTATSSAGNNTDAIFTVTIDGTDFESEEIDLTTATDISTIILKDNSGNELKLMFAGGASYDNTKVTQFMTDFASISPSSKKIPNNGSNGTAPVGTAAAPGSITVGGSALTGGKATVNGVEFDFTGVDLNTLTLTSFGATAGSLSLNFGVTAGSTTTSTIIGKDFVVQTGANKGDELAINIANMDAVSLSLATGTSGPNQSNIDIKNRVNASNAIKTVNDAINQVSGQRADLGALQNRLEFKISNLDTSAENLQSAESRIRDLDMAKEMTNFTKNNILSQAATAMLAQANSLPQGVLQLLG